MLQSIQYNRSFISNFCIKCCLLTFFNNCCGGTEIPSSFLGQEESSCYQMHLWQKPGSPLGPLCYRPSKKFSFAMLPPLITGRQRFDQSYQSFQGFLHLETALGKKTISPRSRQYSAITVRGSNLLLRPSLRKLWTYQPMHIYCVEKTQLNESSTFNVSTFWRPLICPSGGPK